MSILGAESQAVREGDECELVPPHGELPVQGDPSVVDLVEPVDVVQEVVPADHDEGILDLGVGGPPLVARVDWPVPPGQVGQVEDLGGGLALVPAEHHDLEAVGRVVDEAAGGKSPAERRWDFGRSKRKCRTCYSPYLQEW